MQFFLISKDYKYKDVDYADGTDWEGIKCSKYPGHQRAGSHIGNLNIIIKGKNESDFLWTFLSELIITDKTAQILKENNITGYELKPVINKTKNAKEDKLWEVIVTGWAGMASEKSGIKLKESCASCGFLTYTSFTKLEDVIDQSRWDGSDLFIVWPLPRFIFITDKVANLLKKEKLKGIKLEHPDQFVKNDLLDSLSPGRLSRWMPEERARLLGEPLGIY